MVKAWVKLRIKAIQKCLLNCTLGKSVGGSAGRSFSQPQARNVKPYSGPANPETRKHHLSRRMFSNTFLVAGLRQGLHDSPLASGVFASKQSPSYCPRYPFLMVITVLNRGGKLRLRIVRHSLRKGCEDRPRKYWLSLPFYLD